MEEQLRTVLKEIEDLQKQKNTIENKIQELNQKVLDLYTTEQKRLANGLETLRAEQKQLNKTITNFGNRIKLDVGGKTFATTLATLTKFPESMLGAMFSGRFAIKPEEDGFIFIDRNGDHFSVILDFLRDGKVSLPSEPSHLENLRNEADYFRIEKLVELIDEKLGVNAVSVLSGSSGTGELCWSDTKKGRNIALSNNNCVAKMEGNLWSYGSVFANVSFSSGNHYWEIRVDYSTDDMIGITQCKVSDCTAMHVSHKEDVCFVGHGDGALYGKGTGRRSYGTQKPLVKDIYKPIDDVIGILLQFQGQRSTLAYFKNGEYLFEIYTGMTGEVTPAVELYESPAQVTLVRYMNLSANGDPVANVKKLWNTNKGGSSSAYYM